MRNLLFTTLLLLIAFSTQAQLYVGGGLTLTPEFGITLKAEKDITDVIDGSAMFTWYFIEDIDLFGTSIETSLWDIDLNGHYNFYDIAPDLTLYGLAGLKFAFASVKSSNILGQSTNTSDTNLGLNIGGGAAYDIGSVLLWGEPVFTIAENSDFFFRLGAMFTIGD